MATQDVEAYRLLVADVYELAGTSRRTSEALARELGQTAARWHVLSVISDGPRTVAGSARRLGLSRQAVQRVVDDLVEARQVELRPNPDHARAPLVALTAQGQGTLDALWQRSEDDRRRMLERAAVTDEEFARARQVLRRLLAALDESAPPCEIPPPPVRGSVAVGQEPAPPLRGRVGVGGPDR